MKTLAALALALSLTPGLCAQDESKGIVERPYRSAAPATMPGRYDLSKTGIEWHRGLDAALGKEKPILLLQILGNYDEVFC